MSAQATAMWHIAICARSAFRIDRRHNRAPRHKSTRISSMMTLPRSVMTILQGRVVAAGARQVDRPRQFVQSSLRPAVPVWQQRCRPRSPPIAATYAPPQASFGRRQRHRVRGICARASGDTRADRSRHRGHWSGHRRSRRDIATGVPSRRSLPTGSRVRTKLPPTMATHIANAKISVAGTTPK